MSAAAGAGLIKINVKGKDIRPLIPLAVFNPVIYFFGETFGIRFTSAAESGAFLACIPAVSLACSTLILRKKPLKTQSAGIGVTLIGVLVTVFNAGFSTSFSALGYAALCAAVAAYALYSVYAEKAASFSGAEITFVMIGAGSVVFTAAAFIEAVLQHSLPRLLTLPFDSPAFLAAVLYQGLGCSVLAFFLSNTAIARLGVNGAASFIGVSTVVSILAGVFILRERFTPLQIFGASLILAGIYIANWNFLRSRHA
ncbi:MAG: DMT family transporter [Treponema sp.]